MLLFAACDADLELGVGAFEVELERYEGDAADGGFLSELGDLAFGGEEEPGACGFVLEGFGGVGVLGDVDGVEPEGWRVLGLDADIAFLE